MAQLRIEHPDGRAYAVSAESFADLYEPFGFKATNVFMPDGSMKPYTDKNLVAAKEAEEAGSEGSPLIIEDERRAALQTKIAETMARRVAAAGEPTATAETPAATKRS